MKRQKRAEEVPRPWIDLLARLAPVRYREELIGVIRLNSALRFRSGSPSVDPDSILPELNWDVRLSTPPWIALSILFLAIGLASGDELSLIVWSFVTLVSGVPLPWHVWSIRRILQGRFSGMGDDRSEQSLKGPPFSGNVSRGCA